jgi:hypothetical protein
LKPGRRLDHLQTRSKQCPVPVRVERLHVHWTIPARAHDLREALGIILVGLVDLHLRRRARMPGIEANN